MKREIEVVVLEICGAKRIVQRFPYGENNEEHCIHGIKLRWSCESCEDDSITEPEEKKGGCMNPLKPIEVYLFTNRNCLVFDTNGNQMVEYQSGITCYRVDEWIARDLVSHDPRFYISKYQEWCHPISKRSFEYLLGLRTREMDMEEIETYDERGERKD